MELVTHRVPASTREMLIMPVGDIQWAGDDTEVALGMLKRHIAWGVKRGAWFIGMGDYIDTFSPSNRKRLSGAQLYDTAVKAFDRDAEERTRELLMALKSSKGRWLGLLEGHHYHEFRNQTTTDQLLADLLEAPFLGTSAAIRLVFARSLSKTNHPSTGAVIIYAHHGQGGGTTAGSGLNRIARTIPSFDADIYLMGHHHKVGATPQDHIKAVFPPNGKPHLVHQTKMLVTTGSFLKGLVVGRRDGLVPRGGYAEQSMMNPLTLGAPIVRVRPRWKEGLWLPDINAEV